MRKKQKYSDMDDCFIIRGKLSCERTRLAIERIVSVLPDFRLGDQVILTELDRFLREKYKAEKADFKDIDKCTRTKVRRYNKYCNDVFCVSENHVENGEYVCSYIIKRENCINVSENRDDFFYDMFVIVGSEDGERLSGYYIGGYSEGFAEEMYVLSGNS